MSRRRKKLTVTRRTLVSTVAAVPALGSAAAGRDELFKRGRAWLAMDTKIRHLMARWSRVESTAMDAWEHWYQLTDEARAATSFGAEMNRIDEELARLFESREREFEAVERLKARDLHGVAVKLAVASRLLDLEDSEAAKIVAGAWADMRDLGWSES